MPITPTSAEANAVHSLRNVIANSPTFITARGVADFTAAKAFVHVLEKIPETKDYDRPMGIVLLPLFEFRVARPGYPSGVLECLLEIDSPKEVVGIDELTYVANFFGGVKADISTLCSPKTGVTQDATLRCDRITQPGRYVRSRRTGKTDYWSVLLQVHLL